MTVDNLSREALQRTAHELIDGQAGPAPAAAGVWTAGCRRRRLRRGGYAATMVLAVALAIPAAQFDSGQDRALRAAAPAVASAYDDGTIEPNPRDSWRDPGSRPAGPIVQVLPEIGGVQRGVYRSVDGRRCTYMLVDGGGSSASCDPDLNGGPPAVRVEDARLGEPGAVSEVWGYVPATATSLFVQRPGQEPSAVQLRRGPDGFTDINFFNYPGSLGEGRVTFTAYDNEGRVVTQRTAGRD